ncbi:MAG: hypothetical protein ACI8VC_001784 [Candidatus Endobugula sp.]|jgi:hypothetical protein
MKIIKIAMVGFEYEFIPEALEMAIRKFESVKDVKIIVKLWTSRDGLVELVTRHFPECSFYDQNYLKEFENKEKFFNVKHGLSDVEKKHFFYTFLRSRYFRWARRISKCEANLFENIFNECVNRLKINEIDKVIFAEIPHSMMDYGFYLASRKMELPLIIRDGPYFGNINTNLRTDSHKNSVPNQNDTDGLKEIFFQAMRQRNFLEVNKLPDYMTETSWKNITARVPTENSPFYSSELKNKLCRLRVPSIINRVINKVIFNLSVIYSRLYIFLLSLLTQEIASTYKNRCNQYMLLLLHYHPEKTTSSAAHDTPFEEERIEKILKKFPDIILIALEHPTIWKNSSIHKYRRISEIVKLRKKYSNFRYAFSPSSRVDYADILKNAIVSMSTSGTHALESIQVGVPAIHFSNSFANGFPGVLNLKSVEDMDLNAIKIKKSELTESSIIDIYTNAFNKYSEQPISTGFISGYHRGSFTANDYVVNGSLILYNLLFVVND